MLDSERICLEPRLQMLGLIPQVVEAQRPSLMQLLKQSHRRLAGQHLCLEAALTPLRPRLFLIDRSFKACISVELRLNRDTEP